MGSGLFGILIILGIGGIYWGMQLHTNRLRKEAFEEQEKKYASRPRRPRRPRPSDVQVQVPAQKQQKPRRSHKPKTVAVQPAPPVAKDQLDLFTEEEHKDRFEEAPIHEPW